ncbi:hypothetical protein LCH18_09840 [Acinetobacter johnsonii]|uniref:hypothetical protein n=1 Tax=Acinetobacter johnsonii TaxID=40214 RepID=UPI001CCB4F95|nr:hypothetical protein [Acinetobacter johnsonii]UBQ36519.1 hypothetical protein LCH18_09840 [Acinetobacter johnsonii]
MLSKEIISKAYENFLIDNQQTKNVVRDIRCIFLEIENITEGKLILSDPIGHPTSTPAFYLSNDIKKVPIYYEEFPKTSSDRETIENFIFDIAGKLK